MWFERVGLYLIPQETEVHRRSSRSRGTRRPKHQLPCHKIGCLEKYLHEVINFSFIKYSLSVLGITDEQFRGPVPPGSDVVRVHLTRGRHKSSEAEIAKLDHPKFRHQNVLRLYVSMDDLERKQGIWESLKMFPAFSRKNKALSNKMTSWFNVWRINFCKIGWFFKVSTEKYPYHDARLFGHSRIEIK